VIPLKQLAQREHGPHSPHLRIPIEKLHEAQGSHDHRRPGTLPCSTSVRGPIDRAVSQAGRANLNSRQRQTKDATRGARLVIIDGRARRKLVGAGAALPGKG
jgi:hypothetical protein